MRMWRQACSCGRSVHHTRDRCQLASAASRWSVCDADEAAAAGQSAHYLVAVAAAARIAAACQRRPRTRCCTQLTHHVPLAATSTAE